MNIGLWHISNVNKLLGESVLTDALEHSLKAPPDTRVFKSLL